jgi:hypothetical protein
MIKKQLNLYAFYLGGKFSNISLEVHDIVFAVGNHIEECYPAIKKKWVGDPTTLHIDAYVELNTIKGYDISVEFGQHVQKDGAEDMQLYFVYLGGSKVGEFIELHKSGFVVSKNANMAKVQAKHTLALDFEDKHMDNIMEIDECLNIQNELNGYKISLFQNQDAQDPVVTTCYTIVK